MQTAWLLCGIISVSPPESGRHTEEGFENVVGLRPAYARHINRARPSAVPGEVAPEADDLGGFVLTYERVLYRHWLALELNKPFYFGHGRFDSPFEVLLRFQHRWGRVEPFVGVGMTWNIRTFQAEREAIEGSANALSFGVAAATGLDVWVAERWALGLSVGYVWVAFGDVVAHELNVGVGPLFAF